MHVLPNEDLIQAYSKKRLTPMINNSEVLRKKVGVAKSRDSSNTIEEKSFPGGYVTIVGANAPAGLSSRPVQIVLCDEVDRFPISSGKEGDPIALATARTKTFRHKRRHLFVSTPVDKETSRIYQLYEDSTMEQWCLPCPHCGELQPLRFKDGIVYEHYISESGEIVVTKAEHRCMYCGMLGSEKEWKRGEGAWIARKEHSTRRGFHINQLSSPWSDWREVAKAFLVAKREGVDKLKVFVNTVLGEPWETEKKGVDDKSLAARREDYPYDVPPGVKVITAAVDTQDDRFEIEVKAGVPEKSHGALNIIVFTGISTVLRFGDNSTNFFAEHGLVKAGENSVLSGHALTPAATIPKRYTNLQGRAITVIYTRLKGRGSLLRPLSISRLSISDLRRSGKELYSGA
ncbi:Phage terminase large subunit (GpA) [Paenibacillus sp. P1XP2]|nr:Phage terminase large subunit (GpA) [Paenibacillus sp. P1XP2]